MIAVHLLLVLIQDPKPTPVLVMKDTLEMEKYVKVRRYKVISGDEESKNGKVKLKLMNV